MEDKEDIGWHLDKKVPIAIVLMIAGQTAMGVWYVSNLDSRVTLVETRTESFWRERDSTRDRLLILEQRTSTILDTVSRIDRRLDPGRRVDGP